MLDDIPDPAPLRMSHKIRLLKFLNDWRERLLARRNNRAELLTEEEMGQIITLNTIISYVEDFDR